LKPIQTADSGAIATDAPALPATPKQWKQAWKDQPNADLRDYIANAEAPGADQMSDYGYTKKGDDADKPALGRYQIQESNLIGLGLKSAAGPNGWGASEFANKYGIKTDDDFLTNEAAQEAAMTAYMTDLNEKVNELYAKYGGKTFTGVSGQQIIVTRAGLLAALHRTKPSDVDDYFNAFQAGDTNGQGQKMTEHRRWVEKRLREAQSIPY